MQALISRVSDQVRETLARDVDCVTLCIKILDRSGILPDRGVPGSELGRRRTGHWLPPRIFLLLVLFMTLVASPAGTYYFWRHKLTILMGPVISGFVTGMGLVMLVSLLYRDNNFYDMVDKLHAMRECRHVLELPEDVALGFKTKSKVLLMVIVVSSTLLLVLIIFAVPVYYFKRIPFFEYNYPNDQTKLTNYKISFALVIISLFSSFQLNVIVSSFLMACLLEAFYQLRLLNYNLSNTISLKPSLALEDDRQRSEHVEVRSSESESRQQRFARFKGPTTAKVESTKLWRQINIQEASERLRFCICQHKMIIKYVRSVEDAFQPYLIQQYMCTIFPVVLIIVHITHSNVFDMRLVVYLVLVCAVTFHQVVFCWLSKKLTDEDEAVRLAVYSMDWFEASESFKRSLRIIMSRSNQPLAVKVAGMIQLNMETFSDMVKAIYTYYMSLATTMHVRIN